MNQKILNIILFLAGCFAIYQGVEIYNEEGLTISILTLSLLFLACVFILLKKMIPLLVFTSLYIIATIVQIAFFDFAVIYRSFVTVPLCAYIVIININHIQRNKVLLQYSKGLTFAKKEKYEKAIESFTKAIELQETFMPAYLERGYVYASLEDNKKALQDLEKVLELDPNNERAKEKQESILKNL